VSGEGSNALLRLESIKNGAVVSVQGMQVLFLGSVDLRYNNMPVVVVAFLDAVVVHSREK